MTRRWRRLRRAIRDFPFDQWLEGHYSHAWVGDDDTGGVRRGKFHVWGEGSVGHSPDKPCACADMDGPIGEREHPLVERYDYRNRADYWRHLVADWYDMNLGPIGRMEWTAEDPTFPDPNLLDKAMHWLVGRAFSDRDRVRAPHREKDSIYTFARQSRSRSTPSSEKEQPA